MKKFVLTAMLLTIIATPALAQLEDLGLFADNAGLSCEILDTVAGIKRVYVVHVNSLGATGSEFLVDTSASTMSLIVASAPAGFLTIGSSDTGISIAYQECKIGTFLVLTMTFDNFGDSAACSRLRMLEDPTAVPPARIYADCSSQPHNFPGGQAIVNPNPGSCPCSVATETTTWGNIKALYR
jgi:hypothetical protein